MKNLLTDNQVVFTVDLEDWFHSLDHLPSNWPFYERRIEYGTNKILDLLEENKSIATFFVLGDIAANNPRLVKTIAQKGHEIGSHGFEHNFIYRQSREEFRNDLKNSRNLLSDLTGEKINSFRAPYFSITKNSLWALEILKEEGFKVDSSIFPVINHRYGIRSNERLPYKFENGLWEWPITTYKSFIGNIPFAGGVYFRFFPITVTKYFTSSLKKKSEPILFYFHPWEFDDEQPRINSLNPFLKLRHYFGLKKNFIKLNTILSDLKTISLSRGINILTQMDI